MTDKVTSPSDSTIITQLTAYLDGELETDEVRDVEERISSNNRYQKLLHQLLAFNARADFDTTTDVDTPWFHRAYRLRHIVDRQAARKHQRISKGSRDF